MKGSKISTSSTKFVVFGPIGKTRWPPWPLIDWDIFDFFSMTANWYSSKLERKQDLNILDQGCVLRADWKNKMATQASDWLRHSPLNPLNGIQQNLTGRKISTSSNKFVFFGSIGGTRWPPGLWFAETFSTFPQWPLNKIQRNLTGSTISMSSTKFVLFDVTWQEARYQRPLQSLCFRADRKNKMAARTLIGWDIFDFSSERNSTKLDRK